MLAARWRRGGPAEDRGDRFEALRSLELAGWCETVKVGQCHRRAGALEGGKRVVAHEELVVTEQAPQRPRASVRPTTPETDRGGQAGPPVGRERRAHQALGGALVIDCA